MEKNRIRKRVKTEGRKDLLGERKEIEREKLTVKKERNTKTKAKR